MAEFSKTNLVIEARLFARNAHWGQQDKGDHPYFGHLTRVAGRVWPDPDAEAVAFLHDILEDTTITEEELRERFPDYIVDAVVALTKVKNDGRTYKDYIRDLASNPLAKKVKLADLADNTDPTRRGASPKLLRRYAEAKEMLTR